jgi:hypothetical protein
MAPFATFFLYNEPSTRTVIVVFNIMIDAIMMAIMMAVLCQTGSFGYSNEIQKRNTMTFSKTIPLDH